MAVDPLFQPKATSASYLRTLEDFWYYYSHRWANSFPSSSISPNERGVADPVEAFCWDRRHQRWRAILILAGALSLGTVAHDAIAQPSVVKDHQLQTSPESDHIGLPGQGLYSVSKIRERLQSSPKVNTSRHSYCTWRPVHFQLMLYKDLYTRAR
jgi:hypothetical protein